MKKVMEIAWAIARKGQRKHGGKVSEYLSIAMQQAWAMVKKENAESIVLRGQKSNGVQMGFGVVADAITFINGSTEKGQRGIANATGDEVTVYRLPVCTAHRVEIWLDKYSYTFKMDETGKLYCTFVKRFNR